MKRIVVLILVLLAQMQISCVQEDHFGASQLKNIFTFELENQVGNTLIDEEKKVIKITVGASANLTSLKPTTITFSTFANINPSANIALDFSKEQIYTVTAEDGSTQKYTVIVSQEGANPQLDNSTFDIWYSTPKGYLEPGKDSNSIWASGNAGVVTLGTANVSPFTISGTNLAAKLVTQDLGALAGLVEQRMAAGSLFTGKFELDLSNPINSAKIGIPFVARPKKFSVNYAYKPGTPYLNRKGQVLNLQDACDIYVLLENRSNNQIKRIGTGWFRSTDNSIDTFKKITIDLIYGTLPASAPDYQKPTNGLYGNSGDPITHISVVFSSSFKGDLLEGGVNSTLWIDDFQLGY